MYASTRCLKIGRFQFVLFYFLKYVVLLGITYLSNFSLLLEEMEDLVVDSLVSLCMSFMLGYGIWVFTWRLF